MKLGLDYQIWDKTDTLFIPFGIRQGKPFAVQILEFITSARLRNPWLYIGDNSSLNVLSGADQMALSLNTNYDVKCLKFD